MSIQPVLLASFIALPVIACENAPKSITWLVGTMATQGALFGICGNARKTSLIALSVITSGLVAVSGGHLYDACEIGGPIAILTCFGLYYSIRIRYN
jgi:hypothetical protein